MEIFKKYSIVYFLLMFSSISLSHECIGTPYHELIMKEDSKWECIEGDCEGGWGTLTSLIGKHVGQFDHGLLNGYGTLYHFDGSVYTGMFRCGESNGVGTITTSSFQYFGGFKDSQYHGEGVFTETDGGVIVGIWEDGNLIETLSEFENFLEFFTELDALESSN